MKKYKKILMAIVVLLGNIITSINAKAQNGDLSSIAPYACIGDDCSVPAQKYGLSGAYQNMAFPNMNQTYAEVSWTLYVNTGYSNGSFTTPQFSYTYDYLDILTNMGVDGATFYCKLSGITYTTSGRTMTIKAPIYVTATINGATYSTYTYTETFTLTL